MKLSDLTTLVIWNAVVAVVGAEKWAWPDQKKHKIDDKIRFEDEPEGASSDRRTNSENLLNKIEQADEYQLISQGEGQLFGNPANPGRRAEKYLVDPDQVYPVNSYAQLASYADRQPTSQEDGDDGTLDSVGSCRCLYTQSCNSPAIPSGSCGPGKSLCCFNRRGKPHQQPGFESAQQTVLIGPGGPTGLIGPQGPSGIHTGGSSIGGFVGAGGHNSGLKRPNNGILVGPGGPTGVIGPTERPILVGPGGPTGMVGPNGGFKRPNYLEQFNGATERPILVGPGGPTGIVGPNGGFRRPNYLERLNGPTQRPTLVGPGGPTGIIGPNAGVKRPNNAILVGPGGPTGLIGPTPRPVLVGPGGPTGIVGPAQYNNNRQYHRGVLVGPGGPTGIVGPNRYK